MLLHDIAASGRALRDRMRRAHRGEMRNQDAVEVIDGWARELGTLMDRLVESEDARRAEVRAGLPKRPGGGVIVTAQGRVITKDTLFKAAA